MSMTTITLKDNGVIVDDIQLWHNSKIPITPSDEFVRVDYVKYNLIPVYLLQSKPIDIYSNLTTTSEYIEENLLKYQNLGILYQGQSNDNVYIVLFVQELLLKCVILDFTMLNQVLQDKGDYDGSINYIIDFKINSTDTNVFDKVLEKKKRNKSITPNVQENGDQINSMITKVILSGLRLRGLSNSSKNDKIKIKEIYQMTFKATHFAIRKFNSKVKLNDIQDIVEKLLQVFVDINDDSPFLD